MLTDQWPADTLSKSFIELGLLPIKLGAVELGLATVIQCAEIVFTLFDMILVVCASVRGRRRRHCGQRRCRYATTSRPFSDSKWSVRAAHLHCSTGKVLDAAAKLLSRRRSNVKLRRHLVARVRRHCGAPATGTRLWTNLHVTKQWVSE